ncbi:TIR domain-containing protein [Microbacterium oryzae]|uniref:TIR domain-containing protein n=1 Tax=Microbacterium oryzae TaxID=743009 RepID=UPI0025AFD970|nr:TIR domain-containing protein [Microbacterium oryzae]MDN3312034.1 TIR domain-containing protein [Microbacterium oryzae]
MTKHIFLSFVEEDLALVRLFRGQAKNKKSALEFDDYSVKEPYNSTNATYIRSQISAKIRAASVTIVLIGDDTHKSEWVEWEIAKSVELGNKVIGVRLKAGVITPAALTNVRARVIGWDIDAIVLAIG